MSNSYYKPSEKAIKFTKRALSKVNVYFVNGTVQKYYSRDQIGSRSPKKDVGIYRLKKMIQTFNSKMDRGGVSFAILYDNITDEEIERFVNGSWQ